MYITDFWNILLSIDYNNLINTILGPSRQIYILVKMLNY